MATTTVVKRVVNLRNEVNPHFYPFWNSDKPYEVAKGGRGSFKSSVISLKLVTMMLKQTNLNRTVNIVCMRENQKYLRDSVYNQILWAIDKLDQGDQFRTRTSPLYIEHIKTGSRFYFYGANDPLKLKSNIVSNIIAVWFEEFANLKDVETFDQIVQTFIRQKPKWLSTVKVFCSYNPPKNPYEWVNEWIKQKEHDPQYFIDTSSYLDDELGFTTKQNLHLINEYKKNDPDYYSWLFLGKVIGLGTNVYNMKDFKRVDKVPQDDYLTGLYFGMDVGHEVSATSVVCTGYSIKGNLYVLHNWYYSPAAKVNKKPPSELAQNIHDWVNQQCDRYNLDWSNLTMDSAEGALDNQYYAMFGIRWHKVKKLTEVRMIDVVQDMLAQGRVFVLNSPDNDIFMKEHRMYQWDENTLESDNPKVIKQHDHSVDAFKYDIVDNERAFGLKW